MLAKKSGLEKGRGGGQKGNIEGGGDGIRGKEDDGEECKDGKVDASADSLLVKIVKGYSHRDPENHQNNISASTRRSSFARNWRPIYPTPGRS